MTDDEKRETKQGEEPSESTGFASKESTDDNSGKPDGAGVSEKSHECACEENPPELPVPPRVAPDIKPYSDGPADGNSSCCNTHNGGEHPQRAVPLYLGLSILFILLLFYYSLSKSREQAKEITLIGSNISAIGSQIGGLDSQISGFEKSLTRYEQSILGLELKRSLITVEEIISRGNERTLDAALRARTALHSLVEKLTDPSANSKYRVKQISNVRERDLPTLSVIKGEASRDGVKTPEEQG